MSTVKLIEYQVASEEVREVYDDIMKTRETDYINNFWKALANHPATLKRIWQQSKTVMAPGTLDGVTKEMVYIAVSVANSCEYCVHTHTASAFNKGMNMDQYEELLAVIALAHQTNAVANGMQIEVDQKYKQ
jgi:AhpD family alkylhydroperoxidase